MATSPSVMQPSKVGRPSEGLWSNGHLAWQLLCGIDSSLDSEKGIETESGSRADGFVKTLRNRQSLLAQPTRSQIKSTQPIHHPGMVVLALETGREAERMRGGCFPCKNGKIAASLSGSDGAPGLQPDMPVPVQPMQLAPDAVPGTSERLPGTDDPPRTRLPSRASGVPSSRHPSRASRPPSLPSQAVPTRSEALLQAPPSQRQRLASEMVPRQTQEPARPRRASHI
ncbi:hypothetical protein BDV93DRAFT_524367 [Ceratobasidium sp. AG-I]|nr:hypothetical protein BDV93DRAFT_524367 [Ceratobasidium sp. AG-I]